MTIAPVCLWMVVISRQLLGRCVFNDTNSADVSSSAQMTFARVRDKLR